MEKWTPQLQEVKPLSAEWRARAHGRLQAQIRPAGSLGRLEEILERLVAIQQSEKLHLDPSRILIFAADHGVAREGVSLYPSQVTWAMVNSFLNGKATINALARQLGSSVRVVDVGVAGDFADHPQLVAAKVRRGTRNFVLEPAMTAAELDRAMEVGWQQAEACFREGIRLIGLGEMGIGNTTSASAVIAALARFRPEQITGYGTGINEGQRRHKIAVIQRALALHESSLKDPWSVLQCVGGYEIVGVTGAILGAAAHSLPVVVDGWIVAASALAAIRIQPRVKDYLFFAHQSEEKGHRLLLEELDVHPLLNLGMRLGEASGAALAMSLLQAAARIYNEVATFAEAGVPGAST